MASTDHATTGVRPTPAQTYETYFGPAIFAPLSEVTLRAAQPGPCEGVLDVACGTGILTRRLARAVAPTGRVVGSDVNPDMLAEASRLAAADGLTVDWRLADAASERMEEAAYDLVTCQQGLQFFADRTAGVAGFYEALRPGGRTVVTTWRSLDHQPLVAELAEIEHRHLVGAGVTATWDDAVRPFSLGDPSELSGLFRDAGFTGVEVGDAVVTTRFAEPDRFVERMAYAYAAVVPAFVADPAAFRAFVRGVSSEAHDLVARHRDGDHVVGTMTTLVLTAHR